MNYKRNKISKDSGVKLKRTDLIIRLSIVIMFSIVLYDSYYFGIPFHYILFYFFGMLLGRIFKYSHKVQLNEETQMLNLTTNWVSILFLVGLILLRFIVGKPILESVHISKVSDALYLLFIGIYYSKWRVIVRQIEGIYYEMLSNLKNE